MNQLIKVIIEEYIQEKDFFGPASEEDICESEKTLGLKFPLSYRDFVKNYGSGGICGVEILGVQAGLGASVVKSTERWQNLGLSRDLVVIEDSGEFVRCMYSAEYNDERVFSWVRSSNQLSARYETFDDYSVDIY